MVRPILDGARRRFQVAAAEVGAHDKWQRSSFGFAAVAGEAGHVGEVLDRVERFVWSFPEIEVVAAERDWADA